MVFANEQGGIYDYGHVGIERGGQRGDKKGVQTSPPKKKKMYQVSEDSEHGPCFPQLFGGKMIFLFFPLPEEMLEQTGRKGAEKYCRVKPKMFITSRSWQVKSLVWPRIFLILFNKYLFIFCL